MPPDKAFWEEVGGIKISGHIEGEYFDHTGTKYREPRYRFQLHYRERLWKLRWDYDGGVSTNGETLAASIEMGCDGTNIFSMNSVFPSSLPTGHDEDTGHDSRIRRTAGGDHGFMPWSDMRLVWFPFLMAEYEAARIPIPVVGPWYSIDSREDRNYFRIKGIDRSKKKPGALAWLELERPGYAWFGDKVTPFPAPFDKGMNAGFFLVSETTNFEGRELPKEWSVTRYFGAQNAASSQDLVVGMHWTGYATSFVAEPLSLTNLFPSVPGESVQMRDSRLQEPSIGLNALVYDLKETGWQPAESPLLQMKLRTFVDGIIPKNPPRVWPKWGAVLVAITISLLPLVFWFAVVTRRKSLQHNQHP